MVSFCVYYGFSLIFFIFEHNCKFFEFILFRCQTIIIMTRPIEEKLSRKNAQRWKKAYLDMLIVLVIYFMLFGLRHSYVAKFNLI